MENIYTVYKISCNQTHKCYIGQTLSPLNIRLSKHLSDFKQRPDNRPLHSAFIQFGIDCWIITPIETGLSLSDSIEREKHYIAEYNSFYDGYNGSLGGLGTSGCVWTEEMRQAASNKLKEVFANKPIEELRISASAKELMSKNKLEHHWRSEKCVVNGVEYNSLRQAAIAYTTTIYKVKISMERGSQLEHGNVDWERIDRIELAKKEAKYLKRKGVL